MDRRIRQNGLAHSPKWTGAFAKMDQHMHDTLYMCIYSSGLGAFAAWARARPPPGGPEPQKPPAHSNIYTCMVYHACAGPFWRMRQSILANAPIHFIECASLFWRISDFRVPWISCIFQIRFRFSIFSFIPWYGYLVGLSCGSVLTVRNNWLLNVCSD